MEILPGEVGEIYLPILEEVPDAVVHHALVCVDQIVRKEEDIEKALELVDRDILEEYLGVPMEVSYRARRIWKKMQRRRLKRG